MPSDFLELNPTDKTVGAEPVLIEHPESEIDLGLTCGLHLFYPLMGFEAPARIEVRPRQCDFYCITHVMKGTVWHWSEHRGREAVQSGQLIINTPEQIHDFAPTKPSATIDRLCFRGPQADILRKSKVICSGIYEFGANRRLLPILSECLKSETHLKLQAALHLMELLNSIYFEGQNRGPEGQESKVSLLAKEIENKPEKWWDCKQMAEYCHLSEVQFRRVFKKEIGYSPKFYLDKVKIERAAELLKKNFSVGNVSELLGFSDQFHFSRRFKTIMGKSPRDYLATFNP